MKKLLLYLSKNKWPALLWTALIVLACSWPGKDLPESPIVGFDKIVHVGMLASWAVLWLFLYPGKSLLIALLGIAFGIALEFYQQWLPFDRTFDWWDAAADGLGTLLGLAGYFFLEKFWPGLKVPTD